jgi:hypothetical protein
MLSHPSATFEKDLKANHGLTAQQVWSNMTSRISQGWVEEEQCPSAPLFAKRSEARANLF